MIAAAAQPTTANALLHMVPTLVVVVVQRIGFVVLVIVDTRALRCDEAFGEVNGRSIRLTFVTYISYHTYVLD